MGTVDLRDQLQEQNGNRICPKNYVCSSPTKCVQYEGFKTLHYDQRTIMHCTQGQMTNTELTTGTCWNIHVSEVINKKESLPLGTVLQKLFHLLEKIIILATMIHIAFPKEK